MTSGLLEWPINVLARPKELVTTRADEETESVVHAATIGVKISLFYFVNLLLYALPLTLAGFGVTEGSTPPELFVLFADPFIANTDALWQLSSALVQNSAFLFVATVLTFMTFHFGVVLTQSSDGIIRSLRTVSYSTGIYLAVMFTVVWYVATASSIIVADDFLLALQADFFYFFIDFVGVNLGLPGGRPDPVSLHQLTAVGQSMFVILLLSAVYYLYVLYLGARISHGATRFESLVAVGFVLVSPVIYVIGVIISSIILG